MKTSEKIKVLEKLAQYRPSGDDAANYANQAIELAVPFIKKHENYKPKAYWDKTGKKWTVGHGHTYIPDSVTGKMRQVREGDTMDEAASEGLLKKKKKSSETMQQAYIVSINRGLRDLTHIH